MPITIGSNIASLQVQRRLGQSTDELSRISERLSAGLRIVKPSDDAAGLAIASSLNADARVFHQGILNINDGVSALNIAEGALTELRNITIRQKELAEQAANGTYSFSQRKVMTTEANALVGEYNRILGSTTFNGRQILTASNNELRLQLGYGVSGSIGLQVGEELDRTVGDGTFNSNSFQPASGAYKVTSADLNRDGTLDIISVGNSSATLDVMIGNGNGTFRAASSFSTGLSTQDLQVLDFNRDGLLDVAVANSDGFGIGILLGNGDGTFKAQTTYTLGSPGINSLGSGDFNGDGFTDLAAGFGSSVYVVFGNGNGTFKIAASYSTGLAIEDISIGDFNNDGIKDIATVGNGSTRVSIGRSDGTFGTFISFTVGVNARGLTVADIDGDGYQDLISADRDDNTISVLRGNGNGTFLARTTITSYTSPREVITGDINGDGIVDLISADFTTNNASVFLGNGDGTFLARRSYSTGSGPRGLELADLNGDGAFDLISANNTGGTVNVLLGNGQEVVTIGRMSLYTQADARTALETLDAQLSRIVKELSAIGSGQSRLSVAAQHLTVGRENYMQAASRIMDIDVAEETARYTQTRIVQQVGAAILAQANQAPALALKLLG